MNIQRYLFLPYQVLNCFVSFYAGMTLTNELLANESVPSLQLFTVFGMTYYTNFKPKRKRGKKLKIGSEKVHNDEIFSLPQSE